MFMKIENLKEGMIVKNYPEMCSLLGESVSTGKSKNLQLKNWERYFKSHKQGHKFIIDEIYDEPLEKEDGRGKSSIYGDLVQLLLLDVVANKGGVITISKSQLIKSIGMANDNYIKSGVNIRKVAKHLDVKEECVEDFYNISSNNFTNILDTAMKNLGDKRIIFQSKVKKVKDKTSTYTRDATDDETVKLLELEKMSLSILNLKDITEARKPYNWSKFKATLNSLVSECTDFSFHYDAYKIIVNDKFIEDEKINLVEMILSKVSRTNNKYKLNNLIVDNAITNAEKRHKNSPTSKSKFKELRASKTYVEEFTQITEALLDITYKKINYNNIKLDEDSTDEYNFELDESDLPYDLI